jgi:hypothetical protein
MTTRYVKCPLYTVSTRGQREMSSNLSDGPTYVPAGNLAPTSVQRGRWGIFNIAYERPSWKARASRFSFAQAAAVLDSIRFTWRFLHELCWAAPICFVSYIIALWWISIAPALSLYLSYSVIDAVRTFRPGSLSHWLILSRSTTLFGPQALATTAAALCNVWSWRGRL